MCKLFSVFVLSFMRMYVENLYFIAEIPDNEYIKYFSPDHLLRIPNGHMVGIFSKFT